MKRSICFVLCLGLLFSLCGCTQQTTPDVRIPGAFYYRRTQTVYGEPDGLIAPEIRETAGLSSDVDTLLSMYFEGPISADLESPFPRDTQVVSWEIRNNTLTLTMNEAFAALTGVEKTLACVCATKTFLRLFPVSYVRFLSVTGQVDGEKTLTLSEDDIRLYDDSLDQSRTEFTLYYTDRQRRYLIAQPITVNLATEEDPVACLIQALFTPPDGSKLYSAIPQGTTLLDYSIDDGLCTVNFSGEFERHSFSRVEAQRLSLLSVVNTLTQLDEIDRVEFSTDGNLLVQYQLLTISGPFVREETAIGPVRTGMNEFDATVYLCNGLEHCLAAIPIRIRQSTGLSQPELVVQALLDYGSVNGFYSAIPQGTEILDIQIRNSICYIDLSEEFLSQTDHLLASVHSIVASVCALDGIYSAQITVEGRIPQGDLSNLFVVLSPQSDWFL